MDIQQVTVGEFKAGHGTVDDTPIKAGLTLHAMKHVKIKADLDNSDNVYVGHDQNVSASNGYPLDAGEEVDVPVDSLDKVWVVGGAADQGYGWLVA